MLRNKKGPHRSHKSKVNPETLLDVLWEVLSTDFANFRDATKKLEVHARFPWGQVALGKDAIRDMFRKRVHLKYWQLEMFARHLHIPTGILLLFSRLRSNASRREYEDNRRILRLLQHIVDQTRPDDKFPLATLLEWSKLMDESRQVQRDLDQLRSDDSSSISRPE